MIDRYLAAIRERIVCYRAAELSVSGELGVDESYLGVKGISGHGARERPLSTVCSSIMVAQIPKSYQTAQRPCFWRYFVAVWSLRALFILTGGAGTMLWGD